MNLSQFDYQLPEELIAQFPLPERTAGKLLHFVSHQADFNDLKFIDLPHLLRKGDLLVFNNTQVIPARLHGRKESGGKVEFLLERVLGAYTVLAQLKASRALGLGTKLIFGHDVIAEVKSRQDGFFILQFEHATEFERLLEKFGQTPLPPYMQRIPEREDAERYQTVYARHKGAVAAPTAGLHFDLLMLKRLQQQGVKCAYVTLHIGAGTFQPVRANEIEDHVIHAERMSLSQRVCNQVLNCRRRGGRVIAVGTTAVRALESAAQANSIQPYEGDTRLFIYPGFKFKVVDALVTNFHLPKSTLLMLVCAFAGRATTLSAYRHAVAKRYRFYSYGDAMLIER